MATTQLDMGLRLIKYLLCAVNGLFVLTGVMIVSVGTTIKAVYHDFYRFLDPSYFSPATILIFVGFFIFVIAFFGCCGALKESTCMVLVFAVSLSLVLVIELGAAIAAYSLQGGIKDLLAERINSTMHEYESNSEAAASLDFLQTRLGCCGYNSYEDWHGVLTGVHDELGFPTSCCTRNPAFDRKEEANRCTAYYTGGCISRLSTVVQRSAFFIGAGATLIAFIQMSGIMFACMLGRAIRRQKTERTRRQWEMRESLVNGYLPIGKTDPMVSFPVVYMQTPDFPLTYSSKA